MQIKQIMDKIISRKLLEIESKGFIKGGHNGPYYDEETPVRNTAHWAVIFSYYYKKTNQKRYYDAVKLCGDYLLSKEARPMNGTFFCRYNTNKDFVNGIIGQAWAIEGLVAVYDTTSDEKYIQAAREVFLMLPFDQNNKLWSVIDIDGSRKGFDMTFNHQLWFATSGVLILSKKNDSEIYKRCRCFFNNIDRIIKIYTNGLIKHNIINNMTLKGKFKYILKNILLKYKSLILKKSMYYKENGYHIFNVYAFALVKSHGFDLDFFRSNKFKKIINYCFNKELYKWLLYKKITCDENTLPNVYYKEVNIYGFPYNAPGFELPYIYETFGYLVGEKNNFVTMIMNKQIELTYSFEEQGFFKNNEDFKTLESRLYEFSRFCIVKDIGKESI